METTDTGPEILVADAIYENGDRQGRPQPVTVRQLSRRTRWTATALTAVLAVGLLAAAIVAAVSAVIIATIVFLIGLVVRLAAKIVGARAVAGS